MTDNKKHIKYLTYAGIVFLVVLSILALVIMSFLGKEGRKHDERTISVSGLGELTAVPDVASFSFTVKETAQDSADAQSIISEKVETILTGLSEAGILEKDIKTESYAIYPKYEWVTGGSREEIGVSDDMMVYYPINNRRQVQVGFDVSQNISLKLRDFDQVSSVLTLLGSSGIENLYGPNFEIDEPDALQEEARALAIKDAQEKAKRLAKDLGVRLSDIVSFNDNSGGYYPIYAMERSATASVGGAGMDMASPAPQLPQGENTITSRVNIVYRIK